MGCWRGGALSLFFPGSLQPPLSLIRVCTARLPSTRFCTCSEFARHLATDCVKQITRSPPVSYLTGIDWLSVAIRSTLASNQSRCCPRGGIKHHSLHLIECSFQCHDVWSMNQPPPPPPPPRFPFLSCIFFIGSLISTPSAPLLML